MNALARLIACGRGAAAVEFAIISVVLVTLLVGGVDFGRTLYVKNQISWLADQAARSMLLDPVITEAAVAAAIRADFDAGNAADLVIGVALATAGGEDYRVLSISYPITLFVPNLTSSSLQLDVTRRVPAG